MAIYIIIICGKKATFQNCKTEFPLFRRLGEGSTIQTLQLELEKKTKRLEELQQEVRDFISSIFAQK